MKSEHHPAPLVVGGHGEPRGATWANHIAVAIFKVRALEVPRHNCSPAFWTSPFRLWVLDFLVTYWLGGWNSLHQQGLLPLFVRQARRPPGARPCHAPHRPRLRRRRPRPRPATGTVVGMGYDLVTHQARLTGWQGG